MTDHEKLKQLIIDEILKWLRLGNYVRFTNLYVGSIWDGEESENREYLKRENICFVNDSMYVKYMNRKGEILDIEMKKVIIDLADIELIHCYIGIYVPKKDNKYQDEWKIFLNLNIFSTSNETTYCQKK